VIHARNLRRVPLRLAAPLDARADQARASNPFDPVLAAVSVGLIGFGIVMVYSASAVEATVQHHDPQYFLKRQALYALAALVTLFGVSRIDYHRLYKLTYPLLFGVGLLLVACIVGFGRTGGGATRWLALGPVHVQPAELAKLALVIWLAYSLAKKAEQVKSFAIGFLPHLLVAGFFMLLCLKQPDFGSAIVLLFLTFTLLFVAGAKVGYLLGATLLGGAFGAAAIRFSGYRYERYLAWLNMGEHRQDVGYQAFQSVISFGSGGTFGVGLGHGLQSLYLPEAHNDFVAAIIGEELGFFGVVLVCVAYSVLVARGVRAALRAPDDYGTYLAFGIAAMFGVQALWNLAVALSIVPTKGLTLPFVSFGGSSLVACAAGAGILLNVSRQATPLGDETLAPAAAPARPVPRPSRSGGISAEPLGTGAAAEDMPLDSAGFEEAG
jgi:cell division protein FtsW